MKRDPTRYRTSLNPSHGASFHATFHSKKTRKRKTINSPRPSKTGLFPIACVHQFQELTLDHGSVHSQKIAAEAQHGLISQIIKDVIFSSRPSQEPDASRVARLVDATMTIG